MKGYLTNKLYIPDEVDLDIVQRKYERHMYNESACARCRFKPERFDEMVCGSCDAYLGMIKLWGKNTIKGKSFISLPRGNLPKVEKRLDIRLKVKDLRPKIKFKRKLKFTGKLYRGEKIKGKKTPDQKKIVNDWLEHKNGLIEAPPRTGKTILGVYATCKIGQRTLIVASQELWLRQFIKAFRKFTNAPEIKKKYGRSPYLLVKSKKDYKRMHKYDIILLTYQKFIQLRQQENFKRYIKNKFSLLIVDECHQMPAIHYSKFISKISTRYNLGLTATPKRVDGMHFLVEEIIGPVVSKSRTTALLPRIKLWESGIGQGKKWKTWHGMTRFMFGNKQRNTLVLRQVFKDLRENKKHSILIAVSQLKHMRELVRMINKQARVNNRKRGENWPEELAQPFWRGMDRKETLRRITKYKSRVTVAITRMVQMGLDIPEWDIVYVGVNPMSSGPMFYQLSNRCATQADWNKKPIVRIMIDPNPMSLGCFRKLFELEIKPRLDKKDQRYQMDPKHYERAREIVKYRNSYSYSDAKKETQALPF